MTRANLPNRNLRASSGCKVAWVVVVVIIARTRVVVGSSVGRYGWA